MRTSALLALLAVLAVPSYSQPQADPQAIPDCGPGCGGGDEFTDGQFQEELHGGLERARQEKLEKFQDEYRKSLENMDASLHAERTQALLDILHMDVPVDKRTSRLEEELEKKNPGGSKYTAGQLLDPSFADRSKKIAGARESLDRLHGLDATRDKKEVKLLQQETGRNATAAYLESQRYRLKQSKEALDNDLMKKALDSGDVEASRRQKLKEQHLRLKKRMEDVSDQVTLLLKELDSQKVDVRGLSSKIDLACGDAEVFGSFSFLATAEKKPETRPVFDEFVRDLSLGDYKGAKKRLGN